MSDLKSIREPKQKRSMQKKQLIIDTGKELFCKNGYHNTTTNEIAKHAGISIGTLYSYFADKETILLELLDQYNAYFYRMFDFIDTEENIRLFRDDLRKWLETLIDNLVRLHQPQKEFYRELETLYYSMPEVAAAMDRQNERVRLAILDLMEKYLEDAASEDMEALSIVIFDFTNALVDRIVFRDCIIDTKRLIDAGVEVLYRMFS